MTSLTEPCKPVRNRQAGHGPLSGALPGQGVLLTPVTLFSERSRPPSKPTLKDVSGPNGS